MAGITPGTEAANVLREVWDADFKADPTEEAVVAGYISEPLGSQKLGNKMHLRKVKAKTARTLGATTLGLKSNLTFNENVEAEVTASPKFIYSGDQYSPSTLTRILDDGSFREESRKQLMASLNEQIDTDIFELFPAMTIGVGAGTDIDDAMIRAAVKLLAKNAKRKFKLGVTPVRAFIHVDEVDNALGIAAFKQYDIRGSQGSAVSGQLVTTYGVQWSESGLVYKNAGTGYNGLILPDAFAIAYNIKPHAREPEVDGVSTTVIVEAEYAVCAWFDSSGVKIPTTVA